MLSVLLLFLSWSVCNITGELRNARQEPSTISNWDPNGYVFFCLCMGRFGNQADHFLGGMAFAKSLNRTLVIPPFRTYRNVMFTEWFELSPIQQYHKAILAEDFMEYLAPDNWPEEERTGFCWKPSNSEETDCMMKEGNPFGPFWDGLGVNFKKSIVYRISYQQSSADVWKKEFPGSEYPVLAFRGAPAHFPVKSEHRDLQKYLIFSDRIEKEADDFIQKNFPGKKFVGIHLRNGYDWANACGQAKNFPRYMASTQCLDGTNQFVTKQMCYPDEEEIISKIKMAVIETKAEVVFVATDKNPMMSTIEEKLSDYNVKAYHADPHLPVVDLAILVRSDHFIGNCISSFTAYAKRARDVQGKPSSFFGFSID